MGAGSATLTFTPTNLNTAQTVTSPRTPRAPARPRSPSPVPPATPPATVTVTEIASTVPPQLHVSGNKLVNASGTQVILHGMNRSGAEYACVQGWGFFDGPVDEASILAMKSWTHVTAVRVPVNEACWNAESYVNPTYAGANYINAVKTYVNLLNANGLVVILDLHWTDGLYTGNSSGCSSAQATCQKPMPDAAQAIPFWTVGREHVQGQQRGRLRPVQRALRVPRHRGYHHRLAVLAQRRHLRRHRLPGGRHAVDGQRGPLDRGGQRADARRRGVLQRPEPVADSTSRPTRTATWSRPGTRTTSTPAAPSPAGPARSPRSSRRSR